MEPLYLHFPDALVIAARDNDFEVVGKLLDSGVSPNLQDELGCTALHAAAKEGWEMSFTAALVAIGRDAVPNLVAALRGADERVRREVGVTLRQIGSDAVGALLPLVKDVDPSIRATALRSLDGLSRHVDAVLPALVAALKDTDSSVHLEALGALGRLAAHYGLG